MKKTLLTILVVLLCLGAVGGSIFGILKLTDTGKFDTKKISNMSFSVGGLDSSGKYMNTNGSIYTKEAFECQGLNCSLAFDNEVEYQIYFYDQNNDFVHTTGKLTGAFVKDSVPFFAKYARIVVTPKNDDVVSKLEANKYAKQLTVKVNREQGFKNYTENLAVCEFEGKRLLDGVVSDSTDDDGFFVLKKINITGYKEALVFRVRGDYGHQYISFYDSNSSYIGSVDLHDNAYSFTSSQGVVYYFVDFKNLVYSNKGTSTAEPVYICATSHKNSPVEIYCR